MLPFPRRFQIAAVALALAVGAGCSPRTVEKTKDESSGPVAPLPKENRLADPAAAATPFLAEYSGSSIPWQPWGSKAMEAAKASQRPLLIHVGYSTCPFTRRLRQQVLEIPLLADFLKENFVCVVADSEDNLALNQLLLESLPRLGTVPAWPMLVWTDPDGRPFQAHDFTRKTGFTADAILATANAALSSWKFGNGYATRTGEEILQRAAPAIDALPEDAPSDLELLDEARHMLASIHDPSHGTLSLGQNFPRPNSITLSLALSETHPPDSFQRKDLRDMAARCLTAMREGAIRDPLDACFHRYSEKPNWNAPHSEKMLVDQAAIASAYLLAARVLDAPRFADTAFETLDAVLAGWRSAEGLYVHAKTAFVPADWPQAPPFLAPWFIWSASELKELLDDAEERVVFHVHGIRERGNMPPAIFSPLLGNSANVLGLAAPPEKAASDLAMDRSELDSILARAHAKMREHRAKRPGALIDERATVSGNALLLAALAQASRAPGGERFLEPAARLSTRLRELALAPDGKLLASGWWKSTPLPGLPNLSDHACLLFGLLEWQITRPEPTALPAILALGNTIQKTFHDAETGGFRSYQAEELLPGQHAWFSISDTAIPSDIALMATNLRLLAQTTGDSTHLDRRKSLFPLLLRLSSQWKSAHSLLAELALDHPQGSPPPAPAP